MQYTFIFLIRFLQHQSLGYLRGSEILSPSLSVTNLAEMGAKLVMVKRGREQRAGQTENLMGIEIWADI